MTSCTYRFKNASGEEVTITGQAEMKAFLADGGLEQLLPGKVLPWRAKPADGEGRAVAGGQEGVNGYFYKGGQFLPTTMAAPGKWKVDKKWITSGRALVAPGEFAYQPTPFSRSLFEIAGVGHYTVVGKDGKMAVNVGVRANDGSPVNQYMEIRPGVKGVVGKESLTLGEIVDAWNGGQRWFDVKPDAETLTTESAPAATADTPNSDDKPAKQTFAIDDFGAKLAGARKDMQASISKEWSDDEIASQPFSKVWPAADIDAIEDPFEASVMFAAREEIPAKPRVAYKVKAWVAKVKMFRELVSRVIGKVGRERFLDGMKEYGGLDGFRAKVMLLEAIDRSQWKRIGRVDEYPDAYTFNDDGTKTKTPQVVVEIDGRRERFDGSRNVLDALDKINEKLGTAADPKKMQFEVRGREGMYSINKKGDREYRKLKTFATTKEAFAYIKDNYDDLVAAWDGVKDRDNVGKGDVRNDTNRPRTGSDYRNGKDVTPEQFGDTFGFRGVQFGNWVSQGAGGKDRQGMLNQAYDALMDLANIVGVPPKAISLNGSLGLAFGSRGSGNASAHFEPGNLVINLTKTRGAGTLAHEWFHALDNYFSRQRGGEVKIGRGVGAQEAYRTQNYITYRPEPMYVHKSARTAPMSKARLEQMRADNPKSGFFAESNWQIDPSHPQGVRPEVERAFADLVEALDNSPMKARSAKNDKGEDGYWSRIIERGARSFENYVIHKMRMNGYDNDYLANVRQIDDFARDKDRYPYLIDGEIAPVAEAFDSLFAEIKTKETEQGVAMFRTDALPDTITVDDVERPTTNSTGKPINPTEEGVRNFWRWFGESRVVDEQGRPLVVYHGTRRSFDSFVPSKPRGAFGNPVGIYFDTDRQAAEEYAMDVDGATDEKSRIIEAYVRIANDGDGVIKTRTERGLKQLEIIAFRPDQIKSATGNTGAFSASPDIRLRTDAETDESAVSRDAAESFVRQFVEEYPSAPEIILAENFSQLPDDVQRDAIAQGSGPFKAKGAMKNGKIYVLRRNHYSMADMEATVFHEVLGHAGTRKLLGPKFSQELNKLFIGLGGYSGLEKIMAARGMSAQFHGYMDGVRQAKERNPDLWTDALAATVMTEEVFAHIAEQKGGQALRDRFMALVGMVRDWLRNHGFAELASLGESDILFMLQRARAGMREPSGIVRNGVRIAGGEVLAENGQVISVEGDRDFDALKVLAGRLGLTVDDGPTVFSFAGESSKTSSKRSLKAAKSRIDAGENKNSVREDTGWFKGADGRWRFEINDSDATLKTEALNKLRVAKYGSSYALSTIMDHPKLYAAYPFLRQVRVFDTDFSEMGGSFDGESGHIQVNLDFSDANTLSFLMHEIQHAIQNYEGFASGTSGVTDSANYRRSAGEVEARNVQSRISMTDAERRATPPSATADVADSDVIVVFNGKEMQNAPIPANAVSSDSLPESQKSGDDARMDDANNVAGKQAPTPAGDVEAVGAKPDFNAAAEQILAAIQNDDSYSDFGLRVIPGEFSEPIAIGGSIPNSFVWSNGDKTDEEIPGVSTAGIDSHTLQSVVRAIKNLGAHGKPGPNGYYFGDRIVLVKGERVSSGEDVGETIIADPEVVGIWRKPTQGNSELIPNEPTPSDTPDGAPALLRTINTASGRKTVRDHVAEAYSNVTGESAKTFNWWQRTVGSQYGKAKSDKDFGRVYDAAHAFLDGVSAFAKEASERASGILPHLDTWRDVAAGANVRKQWADSQDYQAIAPAIFDGTLANGTTGKVWTDDQLRDKYDLNDKQIGHYREFRAAVDFSLETLAASEMARLARASKMDVADRDMGMPDALAFYTDQLQGKIDAVQQAREEMDLRHSVERENMADLLSNVPNEKTRAESMRVMEERQAEESAKLDKATKQLEDLLGSFNDKARQIRKLQSEGYAPLMRFGQYTVDVVKLDDEGQPMQDDDGNPDRPFFGMFESEAEARKAEKILAEEYPGYTVTRGVLSTEANQLYRGLTPETAEMFARLLGTDENEAFQAYLKQAVANRSAMKRLINRMGVEGFATDVPRVLSAFITSNARLSSGNWYFGEMSKAVEAIPKHKGDVKTEAVRLMQYVQNPVEEAAGLRGFLFFSFLGGSIASALVNLTQTFTTTLPYLSQFGASDVAKALPKAMALSGKMMKKGLDAVSDKDLKDALRKASDEGVVDPQEIHLLMAEAGGNGASVGFSGLAGAMKKEWATPAARVTRSLSQAWGMLFGAAEKYNRHVAFIAAWEVAPKGVDRYEFAKNAVTETQFDYTKASRPNWARGAVGATLFTFKTFSINYIEFMSRLPSRERAIALGVLFLLSGMSGAPGSDDLEDVVDTVAQKMGYNWNSEAAFHGWLVRSIGFGGADFVERGISSMLPLDVSARLGMGNLIPGTAVLQKSNASPARDVQEFFGPAGSVVAGFREVFDNAGGGKGVIESGLPLLPKMYRDVWQAVDMVQTGQYRDTKGRKVVDVDGVDALLKGIGFQPNAVAEPRRIERMLAQSSGMQRIIRQDISELWARGVAEQDAQKIESARSILREWNEKNPDSRIVMNPTSIAQRVRAMRLTSAERLVKATPKDMRNALAAEMAIQQ